MSYSAIGLGADTPPLGADPPPDQQETSNETAWFLAGTAALVGIGYLAYQKWGVKGVAVEGAAIVAAPVVLLGVLMIAMMSDSSGGSLP